MRKQERQVLENAIKTMNSVVNYSIENDRNSKSVKDYIDVTVNELIDYASIQYRFAGMQEKDFDEFTNTAFEFKLVMHDKINNSKENERNENFSGM